jgi:hypothetical protein
MKWVARQLVVGKHRQPHNPVQLRSPIDLSDAEANDILL